MAADSEFFAEVTILKRVRLIVSAHFRVLQLLSQQDSLLNELRVFLCVVELDIAGILEVLRKVVVGVF